MSSFKALGVIVSPLLLLCISLSNFAGQGDGVSDEDVARVLNVSQDIAYGEYLAGECASCHSAEVVAGSNVPVIQGVSANYLVRALLEYQSGVRENSTMKNVVVALGDEDIAGLAHYLATQIP
jgi:cytochrome c